MKNFMSRKRMWIMIALITLGGGILRTLCCFRGYPYQLHPDEHTIVDSAIEMLSRHSWESYVYNRPDQFEIKCCSILFQFFSFLRYRIPAYEAFELYPGVFYIIARIYTVFWGCALIPFGALLAGRIFKKEEHLQAPIQILTAGLFSFSYIFVQHSAYATPDIVLTFFFVVIAYESLNYMENGNRKALYLMAALTGIAITIKYPAAVITLYIACIVIYRAVSFKQYRMIVISGFQCAGIMLITMFITAPNLFTDIHTLIGILGREARTAHLGADGLGLFGNMNYYFTTAVNSFGYVSVICFFCGLAHLIRHHRKEYLPLLLNTGYWMILSILSLHWLRWGFPMYIAYVLITAAGFLFLFEQCRTHIKNRFAASGIRFVVATAGIIGMTSILLTSVSIVVYSLKEDTRVHAMEYCAANNITVDNSIYEGYTPLHTAVRKPQHDCFVLEEDGSVTVVPELADKEYLVISSSYKKRYAAKPDLYPAENMIYQGIENTYPLIYSISGKGINHKANDLKNIREQIKYLLSGESLTGNSIYIYDLKP